MKSKRLRKKYQKKNGTYINPHEIYDLDYTIAKFIAPRLRLLAKTTQSFPHNLEFEEWKNILKYIADTFDLVFDDIIITNNPNWKSEIEKRNKRMEEGLNMFVKYYSDLWC